ncbi:MAG: DUF501 domain-containing protein [Planctomycetes bacterium]|nr:DUF501 domain-containing protein [Planctomycetota bacterium]
MDPDEAVVARQIGRPPRGLRRVEARCAFGYPTVVSVAPFVGRRGDRPGAEPFPTLFWLTCPILVEQVSRLEAAGGVRSVEEEAGRDPALAAGVARDHARCAEERWEAAGPGGRARAEAEGVAGILRETGIGGVRDRAFVKCLHAQVAFHLARGGAVGALLAARHRLEECDPGSVRCDAYGVKVPGRGDRTSR